MHSFLYIYFWTIGTLSASDLLHKASTRLRGSRAGLDSWAPPTGVFLALPWPLTPASQAALCVLWMESRCETQNAKRLIGLGKCHQILHPESDGGKKEKKINPRLERTKSFFFNELMIWWRITWGRGTQAPICMAEQNNPPPPRFIPRILRNQEYQSGIWAM